MPDALGCRAQRGRQEMAELPRLNGVIGALEKGRHALTTFTPADVEAAIALATAKYDAVVYEMEHNAYDIRAFRDCLQYMLNRRQIAQAGSLAPAVAPFARIPPNGGEKAQFHAKQVLDLGAYGIIWPHISAVEQAYNAVAACRYPRLKNKPLYEPAGIRGDGPTQAVRYWGLTQQDYYERADVWPLNPRGEIFVILMIEDTEGINNLKDILKNVPGIGASTSTRSCSRPWRRSSIPAARPMSSSAIRMWRRTMSSVSSRKATAF